MRTARLTLINPLGLHARAASKLVNLTKGFASDIQLSFNGQQVSAKSIMSVMLLAAPVGSELAIDVDGDDEDDALAAVTDLINDGFGELDES